MVQTEFVENGEQGNDSLVRFPRTSRHFVNINDNLHKETTMICERCYKVFTIFLECGDRTCIGCQPRRKKRIILRYTPIVEPMKHPVFLTLTLVRQVLTRQQIRFIRDCFTKLRHRDIWHGKNGIYQIEIGTIKRGRDGDTANVHLHIIVDTPFIDKKKLSAAWLSITGDSYIVNIKRCWSPKGALGYLTKHMGKRIGDPLDAMLINTVLHGTRLVQGFGELVHVSLALTSSICPNCGAINALYLDFEVLNYQYPAKTTGF